MKILKLLILTLFIASFARADVATYRGTVFGKTVTLTFTTQLPSAVSKFSDPRIKDPEMGDIGGETTVNATVAFATLVYDGQTQSGEVSTGTGWQDDKPTSAIHFTSFNAYFPLNRVRHVFYGGALIFTNSGIETELNSAENQVIGMQFPAEMTVPWELEGNYPMYDINTGNPPIVKFVRQ